MDEHTIKEIQQDVAKSKDRLRAIEIQLDLVEPKEIIKFKAKVIETLKTIDTDLDKMEVKIDGIMNKLEKFGQIDVQLAEIRTKIIIYTSIISTVATFLLTSVAPIFLKWLGTF